MFISSVRIQAQLVARRQLCHVAHDLNTKVAHQRRAVDVFTSRASASGFTLLAGGLTACAVLTSGGEIVHAEAHGDTKQIASQISAAERRMAAMAAIPDRARPPRIVVLVGSARTGSANIKLAHAAERSLAALDSPPVEVISHTVTGPLMAALPLYNQDVEDASGLPEPAKQLKALLQSAHGIVVVSPEYNGMPTPLLINAISWCSRKHEENENMYSAFKGKTVAVMAAAPGALGGMRGLPHIGALLQNLGCHMVGNRFTVSRAYTAFTEDGRLKDEDQQVSLRILSQELAEMSAVKANKKVLCAIAAAQKVCGEYGEIVLPS